MIEQAEISEENADKLIASGMAPKKLAEMVIKAIQNDILYVLTHSEFIPLIKSRFEVIYDNTLKLHEGIEVKSEIKSKIFKNETPAFCLTYPENLIELKPDPMNFPVYKPVFLASKIPGYDLLVFIKISSDRQLKEAAQEIARQIKVFAEEVNIISNEPITLRDGTIAYECVIDYKRAGLFKAKSIHLSVFKDDYRIQISIYSNVNYYNDNLRKVLRSLDFLG